MRMQIYIFCIYLKYNNKPILNLFKLGMVSVISKSLEKYLELTIFNNIYAHNKLKLKYIPYVIENYNT